MLRNKNKKLFGIILIVIAVLIFAVGITAYWWATPSAYEYKGTITLNNKTELESYMINLSSKSIRYNETNVVSNNGYPITITFDIVDKYKGIPFGKESNIVNKFAFLCIIGLLPFGFGLWYLL